MQKISVLLALTVFVSTPILANQAVNHTSNLDYPGTAITSTEIARSYADVVDKPEYALNAQQAKAFFGKLDILCASQSDADKQICAKAQSKLKKGGVDYRRWMKAAR